MTSKNVEIGVIGSPTKSSKQTAAWVEHELQEFVVGSSASTSSSDEPRSRKKKSIKETAIKPRSPTEISTKEYPLVVISSGEQPAETHRVDGNSKVKVLVHKSSHDLHKSSDSEDAVSPISTERSNTPKTSPVKSKLVSDVLKREKEEWGSEILSLRSRQFSAEESSLDGSRSVTSQSDARSYRDRLRDRVHNMKKRAGNFQAESKFQQNVRQHRRRKIGRLSRADELLQKEEIELEAALAKHEMSRRQEEAAIGKDPKISVEDSGFDFFSKSWGIEMDPNDGLPAVQVTEEDIHSPSSSGVGVITDDPGEGVNGEKTKLLAEDYLGLPQDEWEVVDHSVGPMYTSPREVAAKEAQLLFFPSSNPIPLEERLEPGAEVRYLGEEGLFVGNRPKISAKNSHRLENRLFMSGGRRWFGDDGELINEPDPVRPVAYRPPLLEAETRPGMEVEFVAAVPDIVQTYSVGVDGVNYALLEIHIGTLGFQHHPLFSVEHVIAQRLCDLFSQYRHRTLENYVERVAGRLQSLRQAFQNLQASHGSNSTDVSSQQQERIQKYKEEIRCTREELLSQSLRDRQLMVSLLSCWRDLKKLRETQSFTNTPHKLIIHREKLSQEDMMMEKTQWEAEIRRFCNEIEIEKQEEYSQKWEDYQRKTKDWREKQGKMKGKVHIQKTGVADDEEYASERTSQSGLLYGETHLEEPDEPLPVDVSALHASVVDRMVQCLRPPGEPKLRLSLNESGVIDEDIMDSAEKQRRASVKRCRLFVRVIYNGKEVCRTQFQNLSSRFRVTFNECLAIRIVQPPEVLQLSLFEDGAGGGRHQLADLFLPFPSSNKTLKMSVFENHEFSSDRVVTLSHAGVGSGTFISGSPGINGCLYTSGNIGVRLGWGVDEEKRRILAPHEKYLHSNEGETYTSDFMAKLGLKGSLNIDKLKEWAMKAQLDPNDPANASFFFFLKNADGSFSKEPDYFRLNPLQCEFDFCEMHFIDANPRLKLLLLRAQGEQEFRDWKFVPIRDREIPTNVFTAYEKRLTASAREAELDLDATWSDVLSSHRAWGRLYLDRVYQRVLAQCKQAQRTASLQHVIVEDQVPDISTLGLTFMKWLQPKRPLRPMRKERKKVAVQSLAGQEVRLMVNVIRAFEVPVRKNTDTLGGPNLPAPPLNLGFATVPVRPFVEVLFQGTTLRTTTAEGANPTWNQDLQFSVRPSNSDMDTLFIHLFDEVVVDLVEDDRIRETRIHQRLEKHWLASLHIPFTTLVHNSRIEGTFKMYSPPVLLGYERESHQRPGVQTGTFSLEQGGQLFPSRDATFINLFITVQPALNPPEPFNERLDSSEVSALEEHLIQFEKEMEATVPLRKIKTLVIDVSGKSVCITRFFRPLSPPVFQEGETVTDEAVARFVAMVPKTQSQGMFDIWLTCDQVLRLGWGDSWAHAVLLCCYLLGLGRSAWLLAGSGIPHGQMAYVLVREKQELYWVWDPLSGQRYNIQDSFCPLQHVYGLINDENIWVNQQKEELPRRTQFDLTRRSDWSAALGRRSRGSGSMPAPVGSVQPSSLHYTPTSTSAVSALQDKLEKHLRDCVMKWRRIQTTHWNRYCIATLRKILPHLEEASTSQGGEGASPHHTRELQHILSSHKMCGFPINIPFTTVEAIVDAVRATGVHLNQDEGAEFALAVYIHPFPNNILSVWVYIACLTKLR